MNIHELPLPAVGFSRAGLPGEPTRAELAGALRASLHFLWDGEESDGHTYVCSALAGAALESPWLAPAADWLGWAIQDALAPHGTVRGWLRDCGFDLCALDAQAYRRHWVLARIAQLEA